MNSSKYVMDCLGNDVFKRTDTVPQTPPKLFALRVFVVLHDVARFSTRRGVNTDIIAAHQIAFVFGLIRVYDSNHMAEI